jgi:glycosyltransferase involved in cell wall biosynthesis
MKKVVDETVLLTNKSPDLVFFSTIDPYIGPYTSQYEIDYYFPYPWSGLYMKPQDIIEKWKYSAYRKSILNPNHILQSRRCKSIGIFIEPCAEPLSRLIGKPVVTFPDIVNKSTPDLSHVIIKDIIKQSRGRKIISLLGSLEKRKGLLTLLQAAKKLPEEDFFFVFAGQLSKSSFTENELLLIDNMNLPNAYFFLRRIPEESTFNGIISISSIVFAAYINFPFSSNLVGKAAYFNKPLLVSFGSYMASEVKTNRLGESAKEGNIQDVQDKIIQMTSEEYLDAFALDNGCKEYVDKNSYFNFQVKLKQLLDYISEKN